jgi:isopentenyl-diphosphate delta-isomerase
MFRNKDAHLANVAAAFHGWGIPTADSILKCLRAAPGMVVFASGGLQNGIDIAKCVALGAEIGGMAGLFLKAAAESLDVTVQTIQEIKREIQVCMFATGSVDLKTLKQSKLEKRK